MKAPRLKARGFLLGIYIKTKMLYLKSDNKIPTHINWQILSYSNGFDLLERA